MKELKVSETHVKILNQVLKMQAIPDRRGGADIYEICYPFCSTSVTRQIDALERHGYLERFKDTQKIRKSVISGSEWHSNDRALYRLTPKGTAWLVEDVLTMEAVPLEERIARQLKGVDPVVLRKAAQMFDTHLYNKIATELEAGRKGFKNLDEYVDTMFTTEGKS